MASGTAASFSDRVAAGYRTFRQRRVLEALVLAASIALPLAVAGLMAGMALRYQTLGGWLVPAFAWGGLVAGLVLAVRFGRRHHLSRAEFLRHLERRLGLAESELVNAAEMEARAARIEDPLSRGLALLAVQRGWEPLRGVPFGRLAPAIRLRGPLLRSAAAAVAAILLFVLWPAAFGSSVTRLARPGSHDLSPALVIRVLPGDVTVDRGSSVRILASLAARPSAPPVLLHRAPGGAWKQAAMAADTTVAAAGAGGGWGGTLASLLETTEYAVAAGRAQSDVYRARVVEPLRATGYRTRVEFPPYTRLEPAQELKTDGAIAALLGSRATLTVFPSRDDARGRVRFADGSALPLERVRDGELAATLPVRQSTEFRVELEAGGGDGSRWESDRFALEAMPDRMPVLAQLAPDRQIKLPPEMVVLLDLDCLDDFGLTRLELVWSRNDEPPRRTALARWSDLREARVPWPWSLEELGLVPGDVVRYHLELTDNDAVSGPKTTIGPAGEIRFPSFEEMYAEVDQDRSEQATSARETLAEQKELTRELQQVVQEMKRDKNLRWEQQERIKDLAQKQADVSEKVEDLARAMEQSLERMEQASLFTPEILEKVQQINQMVREIQSPEFRAQMERLQQAIQNLDRREVQRAMENLQLTAQELERNLDRTIEMLQQLQREENLERMIRQAEELRERQEELNRELAGQPPRDPESDERRPDQADQRPDGKQPDGERPAGERSDQDKKHDSTDPQAGEPSDTSGVSPRPLSPEEAARLQERQEALRQELEKLRQEMERIRQEAEQDWQALKEKMEEQQAGEKLSSAREKMQQSSEQMKSGPRKNPLKFGREAEQKLREFSQGMRQAQQEMNGQEQEEVARKLYGLTGNLVRISQDQEELLRTAPARSTRELAIEQQRLSDGARITLDQLYELARESRFITPALGRAMGEAVRALELAQENWMQGFRPNAMQTGEAAGRALDGTVLSLLNTGQSMCNSGSASSCNNPLARMRSLSADQQSLNDQTQQMMGSCSQGQRLSPTGSQGDQLAQMAARQQMIRQGLEEVQQSLGGRQDVLGRLGDLGKEMEEVAAEMRHRGVDERVLRRQERILSRLLTAQRSLRKEGQKEERISRTGINPDDRIGPADFTPTASEVEAMRRAILRGGQDPMPGEFRRLVETYFRSLGGSQ